MKSKNIKLQGWNDSYEVVVTPKKSISVMRDGGLTLPKTFVVGDIAEYDSYNLSYTGIITSITEKTVTIEAYSNTPNAKRYRLRLLDFCWRNWNFDSEKTARRNSETMMCI